MGCYKFVEEIALADCAIDVEGADLADLFETAAAALGELMVDPATVQPTVHRTIRLDAAELDLLLYDWLSELIFHKDRDDEVYTRTKVDLGGAAPSGWQPSWTAASSIQRTRSSVPIRRRSRSTSSRSSAPSAAGGRES